MTELSSMLSTTGLIATLISVLFAVASLVIANRRKKHHLAMRQYAAAVAAQQNAPAPQSEGPMAFAVPPAPVAPVPQPPAGIAENLVYATQSTSSPLFKRLGRVGVEPVSPEAAALPTANEQKIDWE